MGREPAGMVTCVGVYPCGRLACHLGRRDPCLVHSHPAADEPQRAGGEANTIIGVEATRGEAVLLHGASLPALDALDGIHARLESPAARLLRHAGALSSCLVLPLFPLANAGVILSTAVVGSHGPLLLAIIVGLVVGKPLGIVPACALAVRSGLAV